MSRRGKSGKSDESILAHIRTGQHYSEQAAGCFLAALELLSQEYMDRIYSFCASDLPGPEEAEDITMRIFDAAHKAMPSFRGGSIRAWLWRIAQNKRADFWREREKATPKPRPGTPDDSPETNPEDIVIEKQQRAVVQRYLGYLAKLSLEDRLVIALRHFGKLEAEGIAEILLIKPDSLRQKYRRAIQRLQQIIKDHENS